tara:strand:- start:2489 stop:2962 length:474 start_codon:yes stop_codon:yes gene_type:complete
MASVVISGDTSGSATLQAQAVAGNTTLTLPTTSGTFITTTGGVAPGSSGNILTSNGTTWTSAASTSIGVGQTWKTLSLANNTNYTNSTSKAILVNVYLNDGGTSQSVVYVDGIDVGRNYGNSVGGYSGSTVSAIVPVNSVIKYILGAAASASLAVLN